MKVYKPNILFFAVLLLALSSCSEYQKLLKSDNVEAKYKGAKEYFNEKEYQKALLLLEDVIPYYRATSETQTVNYMYAYCHYSMGNNMIAAQRFKLLYDTYPYGNYAEEALFLFAYCTYLESPPIELDQSSTLAALESLQYFITKYPESDRVSKCNEYMDILLDKLELKDIHQAKLFYKIKDYKAAVWTLKAVLEKYPLSKEKLDIEFLLLDSYYNLALHSIDTKKKERYEDVIVYYRLKKSEFDNTKYETQVENIYNNSVNQINNN